MFAARSFTMICSTLLIFLGSLIPVASLVATTDKVASFSAPSQNRQCVVVGGGPVGLATALTLSRPPHSFVVTVLEQSAGDTSVKKYDPTRSYLYNINARGLDWFQEAPRSALQKLTERGHAPVGGMGSIVTVPSDPNTVILPGKEVYVSGTVQLSNRTNYWIPRHQTVQLLLECCQEQNERAARFSDKGARIKVLTGKDVESVAPTDEDLVTVHCKDGSTYSGALVVAADGIDSTVRSCLADASANTWLQKKAKSFHVKKYDSPSVGLKLKALQLPPNFAFPNTDGSTFTFNSTDIVAIRGANTGSRDFCSLGMLPMKDQNSVRPANVNTPFDHEIWSLRSGEEAKEWFRKAFPRVPWGSLVDDAEWERFAQAKGTVFPPCQYSAGSAVASPSGMSGVVMVGDSCHAFPPDIGQGINAGLQDVVALDRALQGKNIKTGMPLSKRPPSFLLGSALINYQRNRGPEHRALIRLARFGAPYQYKQPWRRHRFGNILWTANIVLRLLLNKISFGMIPPAAIIIMTQDHSLSFRQVMRRADLTARGLQLLSLGFLFRLCKKLALL